MPGHMTPCGRPSSLPMTTRLSCGPPRQRAPAPRDVTPQGPEDWRPTPVGLPLSDWRPMAESESSLRHSLLRSLYVCWKWLWHLRWSHLT